MAILEKLKNVPKENRKIRFVTAVSISNGQEIYVAKASIEGYVAKEVRGNNGFGFDEIFELESGKTLAELSSEEKNKISARKKALEKLNTYITKCCI